MIRIVIGAVLAVVGLVWIGQGVGAIGGSFMSGEAVWAVIGAVVVVFGAVLVRGGWRDRARPDDEA